MKPWRWALFALVVTGSAGAAEGDLVISRGGSRPIVAAPTANFTGPVRLEMLITPTGADRASAGKVSFMPGARTHWHTHPLGQTLIVTAGAGLVQREGGSIETIREGDVVRIPPNVRHWHGAAPDTAMTHIAIAQAQDGTTVTWMEAVTQAQYGAQARADGTPSSARPSRAQQLLGDIAPKLAQLTDDVLFGDVWQRPSLSPRGRSLATVSALIALNRPDQLRSHFALARQNGLSEIELVEVLTHLAFYAGWPSAVSAAGIAREVFATPPGAAPAPR